MPVSEKDREHVRRIADGKALARAARRSDELALRTDERIVMGLRMGLDLTRSAERDAIDLARAVGQAELYARARRLGLYRP